MRSPNALDSLELTGRAATHVSAVDGLPVLLHPEAAAAFLAMRAAAQEAGIQMLPVSGFRDFERQKQIWNGKFRGERELLDERGQVLVAATLSPAGRVDAILAWSALPGASRHHWGSDFDVIDAAALAPGTRARLVPAEFAGGAVFAPLDRWLAGNAADFGFYRPYTLDRGGVRPEPWHLSYARIAQAALEGLTEPVLREALTGAGLEAEALVLGLLPQIHRRFVRNVDPASAAALAATGLTRPTTPS